MIFCVCVLGLFIAAFLKRYCSFIHVVLLLSMLPRVSFFISPRSSFPPILSGELQIFGRHPICRCCVVIAFCWCKKKDKNWFLAAHRTIPLFSSIYMKCSCLRRTYQLYCCFLAVYVSFFMHFYRLSAFSFLCLVDSFFPCLFFYYSYSSRFSVGNAQHARIIGKKLICCLLPREPYNVWVLLNWEQTYWLLLCKNLHSCQTEILTFVLHTIRVNHDRCC